MASYKLSENAEYDLIRIHQYGVLRFGVAQADRYYSALFEHFEQIAQQPYLYQAVDYIAEGYRRSICGTDSIFYRIVDGTIEIMNIFGRQDIDNII